MFNKHRFNNLKNELIPLFVFVKGKHSLNKASVESCGMVTLEILNFFNCLLTSRRKTHEGTNL